MVRAKHSSQVRKCTKLAPRWILGVGLRESRRFGSPSSVQVFSPWASSWQEVAFYPVIYVISFALFVLVLSMPIALGQWYGSWKVAWLTLAFEVVYSVVSLILLAGWYMFHFPSPR